ncbi:MAG: outer membrane beta-barrel protein [Elusimicrobiaceae bacterium]|nr:outer membrane beta-barrel protein [Elusimicrobiaceae bacterium]
MKKIHITVLALVFLLMVSLVFAQPAATQTVVTGDASAVNTPSGVIVTGEQVAVTTPLPKPTTTHAHKAVSNQVQAARSQAAGMRATHAANEASLKKGEPKLKVNTTTTTTDVYDVSVHNKKGTTDYGIAEQTVTGPKGKQTSEGIIYSTYQPSKAAQANEKTMELSLAGGQTWPYSKDSRNDRYGTNGLAADISLLHRMSDHLAVGLDYMMLHPRAKTHETGVEQRHYHGFYSHNISLAGKLTLNPWGTLQVYMPMGVGMANARLKTDADGLRTNESHWGAAFYAGLGMQYNITCWMFAGLEYRYTYDFIKDKDVTPFAKDRNLQFHTLLLRVGMRF